MTKVFTVLRAAFGVALFASIAVIYSAIIAISVSGSDRDRDDRRRGDSFGGGFGGGFGFGPSLYYGPSRLGEGLVSRRKTFDILKVLMNLDEKKYIYENRDQKGRRNRRPRPFDVFFYRPYYTYGGYSSFDEWEPRPQSAPPKMGFLESVFSGSASKMESRKRLKLMEIR